MNVILSIKPQFAKKIFTGEKIYEYRKISFRQNVDTIYLYSSSPIKKIVGEMKVARILKDTPAKIWEQTKDYSGISTEFYFQYYAGKNLAIALAVTDVVEYKHPIDPYENFVNFRAPQSYIYTDLVLPFK